jgi:hypothetical protein
VQQPLSDQLLKEEDIIKYIVFAGVDTFNSVGTPLKVRIRKRVK